MKVLLSIDSVCFPLTGIGRYTYELARGLQRANLTTLLFLQGQQLRTDVAMPAAGAGPGRPGGASYLRRIGPVVSAYAKLDAWRKGRALKGLEDHLLHGPNFYLPPFAGRSVATIHDLSIYKWPHCHPPERVRHMRPAIEMTLNQAGALITDTEYTRREVAQYFGWPLARIHAVPLACNAEFRPRTAAEVVVMLRGLGLGFEGYTLFTGTIEPRKNLPALLDAYSRLPNSTRQRWPLVVAGHRGWRSEQIHARILAAQNQGWLLYLGYVPDAILPSLMAGARLVAYPSLYEGFGLPVLEAMACGVPVVCSDASTLPEVAGSAAAFHAPSDIEGLSGLLAQGLQDDDWRSWAKAAGLAQAARFSWQRCVEQTIHVYETLTRA